MSIYKRERSLYRKIWTKHNGPIPKDSKGRSYEIHHIDGDHKNNDISNLKLVTIEEHFMIHSEQGDWGSAMMIAQRMKNDLTSEQLSFLSRSTQKKLVAEGRHHLQKTGSEHPSYNPTIFTFEHKITSEIVSMTMQEFERKYKVNGGHLSSVINGRVRTIKGWRLIKIMPDGTIWRSDDTNNHRDPQLYNFRNRKTGFIILTTQYDLYTNYGASKRGVNSIVRGDSKYTGDWEIMESIS